MRPTSGALDLSSAGALAAAAARPPWPGTLRALREARGVTQEGWAARLGVSRKTVQRWESGARAPDPGAETALLRYCREAGLLRAFQRGPLTGLTLTEEGLRDLLAEARWRGPGGAPGGAVLPPRSPGGGPGGGAGAPPTNLPAPLTSFVGRARELAAVRRAQAGARLLTLTGPGGGGKTRLALALADGLRRVYPHGVWFVELAPLADPALLPEAIAAAMGVHATGPQPASAALVEALRPRRLLLVLDNCEHLLPACAALVEALLRACPLLAVVATSREVLGLGGETVWPVPPLEVPPPARPHPAPGPAGAEPGAVDAVRLFVARARLRRPDFAPAPGDAAVAELCRRLDGLPLAIELAAARVTTLSVGQLAARLDDRFRLLTGGSRTAPERHQTLRATLDWSYRLLGAPERTLFARLAVFVGGFTLDAAEAVCRRVAPPAGPDAPDAPDAPPDVDVLDALTALADQSLLRLEPGPDGGPRFVMLETIREYAAERLAASGEADALRRQHALSYLALAEAVQAEVRGDPARLQQAEQEHDNHRAAQRWLLERGPAEAGLRYAAAMAPFWAGHGHLAEGRRWLAAALGAGGGAPAGARARALGAAASLAGDQGDYGAGHALAAEALALWEALGDATGTMKALGTLAWLEGNLGDLESARRRYERLLALSREQDDAERTAFALNGLGSLSFSHQDLLRARALFEESLALRRRLRLRHAVANSLLNLGSVALAEGDLARATELHEEALAVSRNLGAPVQLAMALNALGEIARHGGDDERAAALCEESLALTRAAGDQGTTALVLHNLGHAALHSGDAAGAAARFAESLQLCRALGDPRGTALCLAGLAGAAAARAAPARAASLLGAARAAGQAADSHAEAVDVLLRRAGIRRPGAGPEDCEATVRAALGDEAFCGAWSTGRTLPPEQAIAFALREAVAAT